MSSAKSDNQHPPMNPAFDPYEFLGVIHNTDVSITRRLHNADTPATSDPSSSSPVLSKDIPLNQSNNTWLRIFLPRLALDSPSSSKLRLVVYFHGGGFVICSAATSFCHEFCATVAAEIPSIVVSVEYRLAPEHRLPAAYDDCVEALHLIRTAPDEWLTNFADLSACFIMGTSAGGNLAYHAGLRSAAVDLEPMKIQGLILLEPFFGGVNRTQSELRLADNKFLPSRAIDLMWELALPVGVDRDHEYSNPTAGGGSPLIDEVMKKGWKVLVTGWTGDPLIDRQRELVGMLEEKGVEVVGKFWEGGYHGIELSEPSEAKALYSILKNFMLSST